MFFLSALLAIFMLPIMAHSNCHILIDPGHGGKDLGTRSLGLTEKDLSLRYATKLHNTLSQRGAISSRLTRGYDTFLKLEDRRSLAEKYNCRLFLSLHINANSDPQLKGTEIYFGQQASSSFKTSLSESDLSDIVESLKVEHYQEISESLSYHLKDLLKLRLRERPIKTGALPLIVLNQSNRASLLIEIGFLSNTEDANLLQESAFLNSFSYALADSLEQLFKDKANHLK